MVAGVTVIRLSCEVTHESGETYRAETLVDRRPIAGDPLLWNASQLS